MCAVTQVYESEREDERCDEDGCENDLMMLRSA
jgi:hypothetical protein